MLTQSSQFPFSLRSSGGFICMIEISTTLITNGLCFHWQTSFPSFWGQQVKSKSKSKEVYWNTLAFEYITLHISMSKAHMSKTHIYGNKLTSNCCNCWTLQNVLGTGKHPVPFDKFEYCTLMYFSKYVSQMTEKEACGLWKPHRRTWNGMKYSDGFPLWI